MIIINKLKKGYLWKYQETSCSSDIYIRFSMLFYQRNERPLSRCSKKIFSRKHQISHGRKVLIRILHFFCAKIFILKKVLTKKFIYLFWEAFLAKFKVIQNYKIEIKKDSLLSTCKEETCSLERKAFIKGKRWLEIRRTWIFWWDIIWRDLQLLNQQQLLQL